MKHPTAILLAMFLLFHQGHGEATQTFHSDKSDFTLESVAGNLEHPWGLDFIPNGILVTERAGRMKLYRDGRILEITGLPAIESGGQGGLLDVMVAPSFDRDQRIFFTYSKGDWKGNGTALASARLNGTALEEVTVLWEMEKKTRSGVHYGSRIRLLADGTLLITTGERGEPDRAQDLADGAGKVHRVHQNGTIPNDNPFTKVPGALPSVYSYGHRNSQGLAIRGDGTIWLSEHGPQGGDEINIVVAGRNYGWPVITHGRNYVTGTKIGEGTAKAGMEQPVLVWTPSIAPSGLEFYTGDRFPAWKGNLFSGSLAGQRLVRMEVSGTKIVNQEMLLDRVIGRIRAVRQGPDGCIYLLTDEDKGALYRIAPSRVLPTPAADSAIRH